VATEVPPRIEVLEIDLEGVGLELARLVDLEPQSAEPLLTEIGIEGQVATPKNQSGGSVALFGVVAGDVVDIAKEKATDLELAFFLCPGSARMPAQGDDQAGNCPCGSSRPKKSSFARDRDAILNGLTPA
jgi:hypothetical protein